MLSSVGTAYNNSEVILLESLTTVRAEPEENGLSALYELASWPAELEISAPEGKPQAAGKSPTASLWGVILIPLGLKEPVPPFSRSSTAITRVAKP